MAGSRNTYNIMEFYKNITQRHPLRYGHQFTVEFITGDESVGEFQRGNINDPVNNITYYVQSSEIPQVDIGSAKVAFYAAGFEVPGVIKYPDSWKVNILLGQDLYQYKRLQSWMEEMSSYRRSGGGNKTIPNVKAHVNLLDSKMLNVVKRYVMEGVWIESLGDVRFEYKEGDSNMMTCDCTFTMQYWYEDFSEGDPLETAP